MAIGRSRSLLPALAAVVVIIAVATSRGPSETRRRTVVTADSVVRTPAERAADSLLELTEFNPPDTTRGATAAEVAARPRLVLPDPALLAPTTATTKEQHDLMMKSARAAWAYLARNSAAAGFAGATDVYPYATVWDLASTLASAYSARELGIITPAQYRAIMDRALATLEKATLYDHAAFNKLYLAQTGSMVGRDTRPTSRGYGWSAIDHGRMLIWLKIIAQRDSAYGARAQAIVSRLDMRRLVVDGYLNGEDVDPRKGRKRVYQEGRIGYEQYAANGFSLWGASPSLALDLSANARPVVVNGQTVLADRRGSDLLTSEPFVLMGLELGWEAPYWKSLSLAMLAAQEGQSKTTGRLTMISEDALPDPPTFFYYYLLYRNGKTFVVTTPGGKESASYPRWVSAKAAFGYHALAPGDYTWRAVQAVQPGSGKGGGWSAGVYEGTGKSTRAYNLNSAAVVLESAAYTARGCAFIETKCPRKN
ncbi:MAG: hypothetical protein JWN53_211 [Gemmatimonadetes bacterium]|nr:hypothetical protein [Gemmatimonadota bacterium]